MEQVSGKIYAKDFARLGRAINDAGANLSDRFMSFATRVQAEERAVEAVAEWLAVRERNDCFSGRRAGQQERSAYRRRAAALLAGETWAQIE